MVSVDAAECGELVRAAGGARSIRVARRPSKIERACRKGARAEGLRGRRPRRHRRRTSRARRRGDARNSAGVGRRSVVCAGTSRRSPLLCRLAHSRVPLAAARAPSSEGRMSSPAACERARARARAREARRATASADRSIAPARGPRFARSARGELARADRDARARSAGAPRQRGLRARRLTRRARVVEGDLPSNRFGGMELTSAVPAARSACARNSRAGERARVEARRGAQATRPRAGRAIGACGGAAAERGAAPPPRARQAEDKAEAAEAEAKGGESGGESGEEAAAKAAAGSAEAGRRWRRRFRREARSTDGRSRVATKEAEADASASAARRPPRGRKIVARDDAGDRGGERRRRRRPGGGRERAVAGEMARGERALRAAWSTRGVGLDRDNAPRITSSAVGRDRGAALRRIGGDRRGTHGDGDGRRRQRAAGAGASASALQGGHPAMKTWSIRRRRRRRDDRRGGGARLGEDARRGRRR